MKRLLILLFACCLLLTACGQSTAKTAIDKRLLEAQGKSQTEIVKLLGLTAKDLEPGSDSVYRKEFTWFGEPFTTQLQVTEEFYGAHLETVGDADFCQRVVTGLTEQLGSIEAGSLYGESLPDVFIDVDPGKEFLALRDFLNNEALTRLFLLFSCDSRDLQIRCYIYSNPDTPDLYGVSIFLDDGKFNYASSR